MTLKSYIFVMLFSTILAWTGLFLVLGKIDPRETVWTGFLLFYITLFVSLSGFFSLVGLLIRILVLKRELMFRMVARSFRQSLLYSFLVVASFFLKSQELLTWWNLLLLILILTLIEYFSLTMRRKEIYDEGSQEKI